MSDIGAAKTLLFPGKLQTRAMLKVAMLSKNLARTAGVDEKAEVERH